MVLRTLLIQVQSDSDKKLSGGIQIFGDVQVLRGGARRVITRLEDCQRHRPALGGNNVSVAARSPTERPEEAEDCGLFCDVCCY
jgi:hypothetical protein